MNLLSLNLDPIFVTNPRSGQVVNVAPVLELLDQFGGDNTSAENPALSIETTIKLLTLWPPEENGPARGRVVNTLYDLYILREMFQAMAVKPNRVPADLTL